MPSRRLVVPGLVLLLLLAGGTATAIQGAGGPRAAVSSGFTYQGRLEQAGAAHDGSCDFQFRLYDAESGGSQVGTTQTATRPVSQGVFTASLDFGVGAFEGSARYLEVQVRCPAGSGGYQTLSPRQALSPAPYALYALNIPLAGSGVASTAARSDHDHAGAYQGKYARTVVVGPVGTDAVASGTALLAALAGIADAGASKPYLLKLEPGVYDLGSSPLTMKAYVDVEGSGEGVTRVTRARVASWDTATVEGASQAELRSLTVESAGGASNYAIAFTAPVGTAPRLAHVTLAAAGGTNARAVFTRPGAAPILDTVTATASGAPDSYGMYTQLGSLSAGPPIEVRRSHFSGDTGGVYNFIYGSAVDTFTITDSELSGGLYGLRLYLQNSASPTIRVQNSRLSGTQYGVFSYDILLGPATASLFIDTSRITGPLSTITGSVGLAVRVGNSVLDGGAVSPTNSPRLVCNFVSDETYTTGSTTACP